PKVSVVVVPRNDDILRNASLQDDSPPNDSHRNGSLQNDSHPNGSPRESFPTEWCLPSEPSLTRLTLVQSVEDPFQAGLLFPNDIHPAKSHSTIQFRHIKFAQSQ